jgi:hypothetical protein
MGSSPSPTVSNICMEHSEKVTLDSAQHKPLLWLCYVDDTLWSGLMAPEWLQNFPSYLNSSSPFIQFTMEIDSGRIIPFLGILIVRVIPFLYILVIRKEVTLATKVYRKLTHTTRCLNLISNSLSHVGGGGNKFLFPMKTFVHKPSLSGILTD